MRENDCRMVVFKMYVISTWVQMMSPKQFHLIIFEKIKTFSYENMQFPTFLKERNAVLENSGFCWLYMGRSNRSQHNTWTWQSTRFLQNNFWNEGKQWERQMAELYQ